MSHEDHSLNTSLKPGTISAVFMPLLLAVLPALLPSQAWASAFPTKTIRIVVPFAPGGSTDLLARQIGEKLSASLKGTVIVENRPGAGGTVGADYVAKADADGHTLLMGVTGSNAISPALNPKIPYDPIKDFEPVTIISVSPLILGVNTSVAAKTVNDLVRLAKKSPVTYGTPGNGTSMHLTGEMFALATKASLVHIPYRGAAAMMNELLGGQIDATFGDAVVLMPMLEAGKIIPLAVTSSKRHPLLPSVPTVAESGHPGFEALSWQGLFAPAKTPPETLSLLSREVNVALNSPDIRDFFQSRGFLIGGNTPPEFKAFVIKEVGKWKDIVQKSGVTPN